MRSIKKCFSKFDVEESDRPAQSFDLKYIQHLWEELEWRQHQHLTSLTTTVVQWEQIPAVRLQNLGFSTSQT